MVYFRIFVKGKRNRYLGIALYIRIHIDDLVVAEDCGRFYCGRADDDECFLARLILPYQRYRRDVIVRL